MLGSASPQAQGSPGLGSLEVEAWGGGERFTLTHIGPQDLAPAAAGPGWAEPGHTPTARAARGPVSLLAQGYY